MLVLPLCQHLGHRQLTGIKQLRTLLRGGNFFLTKMLQIQTKSFGIICTGETYKAVVKLIFAKGASLDDPSRLFNSSLEGNTRRAIDIHEGDKVDEKALKALIRAAVELNTSARTATRRARSQQKPKRA
jgi:hypothetical protein